MGPPCNPINLFLKWEAVSRLCEIPQSLTCISCISLHVYIVMI